jgi:hypothetical protein
MNRHRASQKMIVARQGCGEQNANTFTPVEATRIGVRDSRHGQMTM